jgi:uncharacterized NAD-dependent epimerase/dehydratase family protein
VNSTVVEFDTPFVVFFGDVADITYAKTGLGLVHWRPQECAGQMCLPGCGINAGVPDLSVEAAKKAGVRSLIIGSAAVGGGVPEHWISRLREVASAGIDIVAGLHVRLASLPGLEEAARAGGSRLIDARVPPLRLPVGTGIKRKGQRLLTVGTDCACGKKYTALAIERELRARGVKSDFRATGQTGIMIAGRGIPLDAVVSDFLTGAAEILSPDNDPDHWDVIEGQGSILHPGYLQVTVGLLVGSQPDVFVVCHDPRRTTISGWPKFPLPRIADVIERTIAIGRLTSPSIRCIGVALNTSLIPSSERANVIEHCRDQTGLPCVDPLVDGVAPLVDAMLAVPSA